MEKNNITAVEWLIGQINVYLHNGWDKEEFTVRVPKDLVEQAKEMEKKQIKDAIIHNQNGLLRRKTVLEAEEYYNQTYGK